MKLHWRTLFFGLACLFLLTIGAGAASIQIYGLDDQAEMVTVANTGTAPVDLTGWRLSDQGGVRVFTFPVFTLPGLSWVRIHTGAGTNTAADLFWGLGSDVWNNDGEIATLNDASGVQVSSSDGNRAPIRTVVRTPIILTPIATTPPGGATMAEAYAYYSAGNAAWSMAWGSSDIGQIRRHLNEAGNHFSLCRDMASKVNDPSNTANLELMQLVSGAYVALSWAALWMYDGSDMFSEGRTLLDAGDYVGAANTFGHASETFQYSQTYFGQATTTLQGISYAGTSFGDGSAYTAAIVPILNARGAYTGEFARYAQGWQHTAFAYQASAHGDQATFRSEGTQAMNLFGSLRTSAIFGADASSNYNILAAMFSSTVPVSGPVAYQQLIPFIPHAAGIWTLDGPAEGSLLKDKEGNDYSWGSGEFNSTVNAGARATLVILDNSNASSPLEQQWHSFVTLDTPEMMIKPLMVKGHPAWKIHLKTTNEHSILVLIADRFMVHSSVEGGSENDLDMIVEAIDFAGIAALK